MKKLFLTLFVSASTWAATGIRLDMNLKLNGKDIEPSIITRYGQEAKLTQTDTQGNGVEITVLPTALEQKNVKLKFEISEIKEGKKVVIASPTVEMQLGNSATVSQSHARQNVVLKVVPTESDISPSL